MTLFSENNIGIEIIVIIVCLKRGELRFYNKDFQ